MSEADFKWHLHSHYHHERTGHKVEIYAKPGGNFEAHHKGGSRAKVIQLHGEKEMNSHANDLVTQMGFEKVTKPILGEEEQVELPKDKTLVEKGAKIVKDTVKGKTLTGQPKEKINTEPMTADGVTSDNAGPQVRSATL